MIQNCEPILIAARGKTPTVPRRSLRSAQLLSGGRRCRSLPPSGDGGHQVWLRLQVTYEELVRAAHAVGTAVAVTEIGDHKQIEILVGFDQCIGKSQR